MKDIQIIEDREQNRRQEIVDQLLTDIELFRTKATKAYMQFNQKERNKLEKIETKNLPSYQIMAKWEDDLKPLIEKLESKRSEDSFKKSITKNLFLNKDEIQKKADQLVDLRTTEVVENFVNDIYPIGENKDIYRYERESAKKLFSLPLARVQVLKDHQVDYLLFREIAHQNKVSVNDPANWFVVRIINRLRIRKERKKVIKTENQRLLSINKRLEELSDINENIIHDIQDKKWDLMIVLGLRNQYEKKISELSKTDQKNAVKRLAIFDKETAKFREEQIKKIALSSDQAGLEITRKITKDVDSLLLRVFDLSNIQKNQLVLQIKEHRELLQERSVIIERQDNRKRRNR